MSLNRIFRLRSRVWLWPGPSSWHFVTVPKKYAHDIRLFAPPVRRGFGAIKVEVTVGSTTWQTSIFPDKESESFILPLKQSVRKKEQIRADSDIEYILRIL